MHYLLSNEILFLANYPVELQWGLCTLTVLPLAFNMKCFVHCRWLRMPAFRSQWAGFVSGANFWLILVMALINKLAKKVTWNSINSVIFTSLYEALMMVMCHFNCTYRKLWMRTAPVGCSANNLQQILIIIASKWFFQLIKKILTQSGSCFISSFCSLFCW